MSSAQMVALGGSTNILFGGFKLSSQQRSSTLFIKNCINGALPAEPSAYENCPGKNPKSTINKLESLLYPDKIVAEENIERPVGLPAMGRAILNKPKCNDCETKGLVVCATCTGSGLYIDSILECQGIIVKVRCLGCGGSGNILCSTCGGRGHL